MALLKNYKGLNIYYCVNSNKFYTNVYKTDNVRFSDSTFQSDKIESLEKAIDNYQVPLINEKECYYDVYAGAEGFKKLTVTNKLGTRIFFDDGTDTSNHNRKALYKAEEFEDSPYFGEIKDNIRLLESISKKQNELYKEATALRTKVNNLIQYKLPKKVSPNNYADAKNLK